MAATLPFSTRRPRFAAHCLVIIAALTRGADGQAPTLPARTTTNLAGVPLTLADALARARGSRPQVVVAAATVERARGAARVATTIPNPQTNAQADERTPTRQATATQPLGWLLRRPADAATGRALIARAAADSVQLLADLARDVHRAFYGALAANERLRLTTEQAQLTDSLVVLVDRRVAAGDISALDRDQIALEASRARLVLAQARELALVAAVELGRVVAWERDEWPSAVGSLSDAVDEPLGETRADPTELARLPVLRAARADSVTAAERWRASRLAQIPTPSIVAGVEWGANSGAVGAPASDARTTPIFGLSMPFPIWNQGREAKAEARGAAAEAAARVGETRLVATAALNTARIRVAERAARARYARDSLLANAGRIRTGAVRLYDAGRTAVFPVLDALRVEREVAQSVVQELLAYQEARADLGALLGQWP
jgi:cobalt-zinc-cadmium efflux system outer membrane protein